jgi:hypothetical protein
MGRRSALLGVVLCLVLAAPAAAAAAPRLVLVRPSPVTVDGAGFAGRELVRVTVRGANRTVVRWVRANRAGVFTARFAGVRLGPCGAIAARGARGDRASLTGHRGVASCNTG